MWWCWDVSAVASSTRRRGWRNSNVDSQGNEKFLQINCSPLDSGDFELENILLHSTTNLWWFSWRFFPLSSLSCEPQQLSTTLLDDKSVKCLWDKLKFIALGWASPVYTGLGSLLMRWIVLRFQKFIFVSVHLLPTTSHGMQRTHCLQEFSFIWALCTHNTKTL